MISSFSEIDSRLAARLHTLRTERDLTLERLADRCAVSRAMLSRIERGESSPTAQLLVRVCGGLGITVADLFTDKARDAPVARHAEQPIWRDPATGYLRRTVSPSGEASAVALAEVTLPPGVSVAFDAMGLGDADQHVWLLDGTLEITVGKAVHRLEAGDCLAMRLDLPVRFANPMAEPSRYAVVTGRGAPRS